MAIPFFTNTTLSPENQNSSKFGKWFLEIVKYAVLLTLGASYLLPFYWMLSSAVKNDVQVYSIPPAWIPSPAYFQNFAEAWAKAPFALYLFNTVFKYALPVTVGTLLSSTLVAYGFARIRFKGRDLLFGLCLATMMLPYQVIMVPLFIIFKNLGWIGTFLPLVVPAFFGNPYFIFMLRQFFRSIPEEISDAARMDGASELDILFRIVLPLARPALTVVALFAFLGAWNDYLGPLIYLNRPDQFTLALGIQAMRGMLNVVGIGRNMAYPYLMAISTIVTLPIVIIFFFAQRTFIEGITMTGMKG
ncbi:MAG: carbohydrate ABC transporter permease [Chloroflexi bacterium]|nr:carbohydrate ABC transporter permease [Chloroflexota bacterium]